MNTGYPRSIPLLFASALSTIALGQGDLCTTALAVTPGTHVADGPASGAGHNDLCWGTGLGVNADWYVYTPLASGTMDAFSCLGGADTRMQVFSGSCGALTCMGSSDDACPMSIGGSGFASQVLGVPVVGGQNYYIEWDDRWTSVGFTWQLVFHCGNAPAATQSVIPDCANGVFSIDVTITSLGSAATVDINNDGGAPPVTGVGLGTYTIGPFPLGSVVQYTVLNNTEPGCDFFSVDVTNFPCPLVSCGPDNYTYCYTNNEDTFMVFQSANTYPIAMVFNAGTFYQFGSDALTIYDGLDAFAPVLFTGNNGGLSFAGQLYVSTNPLNALTVRINSDAFTSCLDFGLVPLDWTVSCLDCTNPAGTYAIIPDCVHRTFEVAVDVLTTGSASVVDVSNTLNTDTVFGLGVGSHLVGPFPMDSTVTLTMLNGDNPLCRQYSPALTYSTSSCIIISCGVDNYTYCYQNMDDGWYVYQPAGPLPITITFTQGDMLNGDHIVVYNGLDDYSALLYNGNQGGDLSGLAFNSSNVDNALALRIISDATGSCDDGGVPNDMKWWVGCGYVGMGEAQATDFLIYPNPSDGLVNISSQGEWSGDAQVQVFDVVGRTVLDARLPMLAGGTVQLDLAGLTNGNYTVQLITDGWVKARQVQVAR